ncbi:MAG: GNAT family N-acetyltransferase [Bacteroidales bacterium]
MDLRTYSLEELEEYLTPLFVNPGSTLSLSPLRLQSYLNNPRGDKEDVVLFEMHHDHQLVGFRTLLPDLFYDREGVPQRFAWLSGNWVHPQMRRKGISTRLLQEAEKKWDGRLMYTNYAPDSRALYDHTGRFRVIASRPGRRYYLRSNVEELLGSRVNMPGLLRWSDRAVNRTREQKLKGLRFTLQGSCMAEPRSEPSSEMEQVISRLQQNSLFRRDTDLFMWAIRNPWVTDKVRAPLSYPFSCHSKKFENIFFEYRYGETGSRGMLWLMIHNRAISVPYLFAEDNRLIREMALTLLQTMIDRGCTHTTIRHAELNRHLVEFKKKFLYSKKMPQLIFAHRDLAASVPQGSLIHDGDGDVMFTG